MKLSAGELDRRVEIRHKTTTRDAVGEAVETWTTTATVSAKRKPMGGQEQFVNAMRVAEADARFYLRWRTDIAPATTQLRCEGKDYDVLAVDEIERRQWLEVIAQIVEV
jgi:SPP1 family predicted phage head-tail adaptor